MMRIETRAVLAAAYLGPNKGRYIGHRMLTHAVEVDDNDHDVRVLCGRVELDSLADRNAGDWRVAPTCESCVRRLRLYIEARR